MCASMDISSIEERACVKTLPAKLTCAKNVPPILTAATDASLATTLTSKTVSVLTSRAKFHSVLSVRPIPESVSHVLIFTGWILREISASMAHASSNSAMIAR